MRRVRTLLFILIICQLFSSNALCDDEEEVITFGVNNFTGSEDRLRARAATAAADVASEAQAPSFIAALSAPDLAS